MDYFKIIYTVLGGLGVFFFGMKHMSDSLQAMGGEMIKKVISSLTSNRFLAVGVGAFVTMVIQSSSITTVMLVGFVNAGLMNLTQALGVVFGANIGTTITGWIISIKVSKYGLLLVGVGVFPYLFGSRDKWKNIGQLVFALGFIFFGLSIMSDAFKPLRTDPSFRSYMALFVEPNYTSFLASIAMGCFLTMIIQSSSAMLGITIAMANTGIIPFSTAAALVLGENIGTTITAQLAAIGGSINAKRTARGHACFNLLGVLVILSVFPYYLEFIEWLVPGDADFLTGAGERPYIAVHIASAHTVFNIIATVCFLPFLNPLVKFVEFIVPDKKKGGIQEEPTLRFIGDAQLQIPDVMLLEVKKYSLRLKQVIDNMFELTEKYLTATEKEDPELFKKEIFRQEEVSDKRNKEISVFLEQVMRHDLTSRQSAEVQSYIDVADELESIGDYLKKLAASSVLYREQYSFDGKVKEDFIEIFNEVRAFYQNIMISFEAQQAVNIVSLKNYSQDILTMADELRQYHVDIIMEKKVKPLGLLDYSDMLNALRRIRSHIYNICKSVNILTGGKAAAFKE